MTYLTKVVDTFNKLCVQDVKAKKEQREAFG
ncbi:MAG: hypothetical protein K0R78_897 [Pelosinus sp.]|jgi:hypothetical protein|nr:hypothetical protein [Pelosinus sp.]